MMRRMGSPRRLSRSTRMMGIPPATAASNRKSRLALAAAANTSAPTLARSSLLAVTTGLPAARAPRISSRAGSMPPMTSTTTSMSGWLTTPALSRVSTPSGSSTSRSRARLRTATAPMSRRRPVRASMASACSATSPTRAAPTLPHPSTPTRTTSVTPGKARRPLSHVLTRFSRDSDRRGTSVRGEGERQAGGAPDADRVRLPLDGAVEGEAGEPPGEDGQGLLQLRPGQPRPEAVVDAAAEGQMGRRRLAGDVERGGVREDALVPVGGDEAGRHGGVLREEHALEVHVLAGEPGGAVDGAEIAHRLLHGPGGQLRPLRDQRPLIGVLHEQRH